MKKIIFLIVFILLLCFGGVFLLVKFKENTAEKIKNFVFQKNIFSPAALISSPAPFIEKNLSESQPSSENQKNRDLASEFFKIDEEEKEKAKLSEIQENLDDLTEKVDLIARAVEEITKKEEFQDEKIKESEKELKEEDEREEPEEKQEEEKQQVEKEEKKETIFCEKNTGIFLQRKIVFNEIAWSGSKGSANDEWIELKNISDSPINLKGWQILDKAKQIKIVFKENQTLLPQRIYLLERSDDNSVPGLLADIIYSGMLNDDNEELYLFNENCSLEDEIIAVPDWSAGDKTEKKSIERGIDLSWHTYCGDCQNNICGTPGQQNSFCPLETISFGGGLNNQSISEETTPKILITEVQIDGQESFFDFIELYNPNITSVDISDFQLKKRNSNGVEYSIKVFPKGSIILAKDYFLWMNSDYASFSQILTNVLSNQILAKNNSIALFDKEKKIIDSLAWGSSSSPFSEGIVFVENPVENQSLGRKWNRKNQDYQDTDNNYQDFEIQSSSLGLINESFNKIPISSFYYSSSSILAKNQEIIFDASYSTDSDGQISVFCWDFGDKNLTTTTLATTSYFYSTSGNYSVSLTVLDDKGEISLPATLNLNIISLESVLEVEPVFLDFKIGKETIGSEFKNLTIKNIGSNNLNWFISIVYSTDTALTDWLFINSTNGILFSTSSFGLEVLTIPDNLEAGDYKAIINIESLGLVLKSIPINLTIFEYSTSELIINEIAWMGTKADANDEWIELFNNTNEEINLAGWKIKSSTGSLEIELAGKILPQSYFLLERTNDQTIVDISADQIYKGVLRNDGEKLELRDSNNNLIDFIDCSFGWFAGQNKKTGDEWTRSSMERKNPKNTGNDLNNWETNNNLNIIGKDAENNLILGTPKQQNSVFLP
jgi:PKD repeat protein